MVCDLRVEILIIWGRRIQDNYLWYICHVVELITILVLFPSWYLLGFIQKCFLAPLMKPCYSLWYFMVVLCNFCPWSWYMDHQCGLGVISFPTGGGRVLWVNLICLFSGSIWSCPHKLHQCSALFLFCG